MRHFKMEAVLSLLICALPLTSCTQSPDVSPSSSTENSIEDANLKEIVDQQLLDSPFPFWRIGKVWVDRPSNKFATQDQINSTMKELQSAFRNESEAWRFVECEQSGMFRPATKDANTCSHLASRTHWVALEWSFVAYNPARNERCGMLLEEGCSTYHAIRLLPYDGGVQNSALFVAKAPVDNMVLPLLLRVDEDKSEPLVITVATRDRGYFKQIEGMENPGDVLSEAFGVDNRNRDNLIPITNLLVARDQKKQLNRARLQALGIVSFALGVGQLGATVQSIRAGAAVTTLGKLSTGLAFASISTGMVSNVVDVFGVRETLAQLPTDSQAAKSLRAAVFVADMAPYFAAASFTLEAGKFIIPRAARMLGRASILGEISARTGVPVSELPKDVIDEAADAGSSLGDDVVSALENGDKKTALEQLHAGAQDHAGKVVAASQVATKAQDNGPDIHAIWERISKETDPEARKRLIAEFTDSLNPAYRHNLVGRGNCASLSLTVLLAMATGRDQCALPATALNKARSVVIMDARTLGLTDAVDFQKAENVAELERKLLDALDDNQMAYLSTALGDSSSHATVVAKLDGKIFNFNNQGMADTLKERGILSQTIKEYDSFITKEYKLKTGWGYPNYAFFTTKTYVPRPH